MLLKAHLPFSSTFASVVTAKLTYSVAQALFACAGMVFAFHASLFLRDFVTVSSRPSR